MNEVIENLKEYFADLLIIQYRGAKRNRNLIKFLVDLIFANNLAMDIKEKTVSIEDSIGKQLDVVGQWVGADRYYSKELWTHPYLSYVNYSNIRSGTYNQYQGGFSTYSNFGDNNGGFLTYKSWQAVRAQVNQIGDEYFRELIKLKVIKNSINHTCKNIDDAIWEWSQGNVYTTWGKNIYIPNTYTVVGSPTIASGIASGFSNSNYLKTTSMSFGSSVWEISGKFTFASSSYNQALFSGLTNASAPLLYVIGSTGMQLNIPSSVGTWGWQLSNASHTFTVGNTYCYKAGWDGTNYYIKISDDLGSTWTTLQTMAGTAILGGSGSFTLSIGANPAQSNRYVTGSIDLNSFQIYIDERLVYMPKLVMVGSPTITSDGIASGFSNSNYIQKNIALSDNFSIIVPVKITNDTTSLQGIAMLYSSADDIVCQIRKEGVYVWMSGFGGAVGNFSYNSPYTLNNTVYLRIAKSGNSLILSNSIDLRNWNSTEFDLSGYTVPSISKIVLGVANPSWTSIQGSIDLKQFSIIVNGKEVFNGGNLDPMNITYHYTSQYKDLIDLAKDKNCLLKPTGCTLNLEETTNG